MVDLLPSRLVDVDAPAVPHRHHKWIRTLAEARVVPFFNPCIGAAAAVRPELH